MTLQELESQILALLATEKAVVIQRLAQTVNRGKKGITKTQVSVLEKLVLLVLALLFGYCTSVAKLRLLFMPMRLLNW